MPSSKRQGDKENEAGLVRHYSLSEQINLADGDPLPDDLMSLVDSSLTGAIFSSDRKYRYFLWRILDPTNKRIVNFTGLNPSRAAEQENDQTIRRCISYGIAWGFGVLFMTNIYACCSTDPKGLLEVDDPIGGANDLWISTAAQQSDLLIPCWGTNGGERGRAILEGLIDDAYHLGLNKDGSPKHPSRLAKKLRPVSFRTGLPYAGQPAPSCAEDLTPKCLINTYVAWSSSKKLKCRTFTKYIGAFKVYSYTTRASILNSEGFRQISGGKFEICSRRTKEPGLLTTPRQAVEGLIEGNGYSEVVYYRDEDDWTKLIVWVKGGSENIMPDELTENCRVFGEDLNPSFHVGYAKDEDDCETENLTHAETIDTQEIEEREETECAWIAQIEDEQIQVMLSEGTGNGWTFQHKVSIRTAEQLSSMFAQIAEVAKRRIITNALIQQAVDDRNADLDSRQGNLPLGD